MIYLYKYVATLTPYSERDDTKSKADIAAT